MSVTRFEGTCVGCGLPMVFEYDDTQTEPVEQFTAADGVAYVFRFHSDGLKRNCALRPSILRAVPAAPEEPPPL